MSATTSTTTIQIRCTCGCREIVRATYAGFDATTATVEACARLRATGIASQEVRKTVAYDRAVPRAMWRHTEGLVAFEVVGAWRDLCPDCGAEDGAHDESCASEREAAYDLAVSA